MNLPSSADIMIPQIMESYPNDTDYPQSDPNTDDSVDAVFASYVSTFYTVKEAPTIILICIYVPVFLVAFIGNALLLAIVLPHRAVWGVTSSFLVNLALADILVAVVCIPMTVAEKVYRLWVYGEVMCKAANFLQGVSVTASTFTLAVMSTDRCLAIRHPMKCRSIRTSGHVRTLLIFIWIFSAIIISPLLFLRKTESHEILPSKYITYCVEKWPSVYTRQIYDVVLLVVLYAIPGTVVIVSYSLMGRRLWTPDKTLEHSRRQNSSCIKNRPTDSIMAGRRNLARMLIVMAALFAACWLPYYIIMTYTGFADDKASALDLLSFSLVLGHLNSAVNPILYSFMNKTFRKYMKRLLSCHRSKRQSTTHEKGFLLAQMSWKTKSVRSTFISSFRGKTNSASSSPERRSPFHYANQLGSPRRNVEFYGATANGSVPRERNASSLKFSFRTIWNSQKENQKSRSFTGDVFRNFDERLNIPTTIGEEMSESMRTSPSSQREVSVDLSIVECSQTGPSARCDLHRNCAVHGSVSQCEIHGKTPDCDLHGKISNYDLCAKTSYCDLQGKAHDYDAGQVKLSDKHLYGRTSDYDLWGKTSDYNLYGKRSKDNFPRKMSDYHLLRKTRSCDSDSRGNHVYNHKSDLALQGENSICDLEIKNPSNDLHHAYSNHDLRGRPSSNSHLKCDLCVKEYGNSADANLYSKQTHCNKSNGERLKGENSVSGPTATLVCFSTLPSCSHDTVTRSDLRATSSSRGLQQHLVSDLDENHMTRSLLENSMAFDFHQNVSTPKCEIARCKVHKDQVGLECNVAQLVPSDITVISNPYTEIVEGKGVGNSCSQAIT